MRSNRTLDPILPFGAFMLATAAFAIASGVFGLAHHWQPGWAAYTCFLFAGLYAYLGMGPVIALRLSKNRDLRQALIALISRRQGEWLNRDKRLIFKARRVLRHPVQIWIVARLNEDSVLEAEAGEQTVLTYERFILMPFAMAPTCFDEAALVTVKDTEDVRELNAGKLPGEPGLFTYLRRNHQMSKAGLGPRPSTADEVRELICQLEEAELMSAEA